ncbi:MAG: glutathione S-transferase family protein [Rhodospirillales bacterium]|nr:glutathione S-transferase family protein [Alphaproteobacteria bacterium]MBL6947312.1 glutathione S-transferase family protein [Rhodospirillales bacterium]
MLKVLGRKTSINVQKVMWLTAELGLEVERVDIGGPFGGNDAPEYLAKNPNGLVPTLEDGDFILWESQAICRYLAEAYGSAPWAPEDAKGRARAGQWMDWYVTKLHPPMTVIFWALVRTAPEDRDMDAVNKAVEQASELWTLLDRQLENADFLTGNDPTIGDIPSGCAVSRWYAMDVNRPSLPNLEAWHTRLKARPAYQDHVIMPLV